MAPPFGFASRSHVLDAPQHLLAPGQQPGPCLLIPPPAWPAAAPPQLALAGLQRRCREVRPARSSPLTWKLSRRPKICAERASSKTAVRNGVGRATKNELRCRRCTFLCHFLRVQQRKQNGHLPPPPPYGTVVVHRGEDGEDRRACHDDEMVERLLTFRDFWGRLNAFVTAVWPQRVVARA